MPKKLEEVLLPHEVDDKGKKLETPGEVDVEAIRAWALGLINAEEEAKDEATAAATAKDASEQELETLRRKNETDEQRRQREEKQRAEELETLRKRDTERAKVDVITDLFADKGITAAQARRLAKRVGGEDEKAWKDDARELVEDGFKVGGATTKATETGGEDDDPPADDLSTTPRVQRNGVVVPPRDRGKAKSVAEELDAAGVGGTSW